MKKFDDRSFKELIGIVRKICLIVSMFLSVSSAFTQHQEIGEKPGIWKEKQASDTNSLIHAFKRGTANGHLRYFFMATDNAEGLTDYFANAAGGGIKFETASFKGFQVGISGFFTFNIGSSNLTIPDPITKQKNRYEIGLFDITDPGNKSDIDRLEELFLKYHLKKGTITLGKQLINTPFINLQDGRMRPTEVGGLWTEFNNIHKTKIEGGLLNEISPRGTVKWYSAEASIGVYSGGVNADGSRSNYAGNTKSKGLVLLGITNQSLPGLTFRFWNLLTENVFNATLLQTDLNKPLNSGGNLVAGVQFINLQKMGNGGNDDLSKRYMQQESATTFGGNLGWENSQWKTSLNFNRITGKGRYLMPREWGRDPFYTFMSRERNEGIADTYAYVAKLGYSLPKSSFRSNIAFGIFDLPAVDNHAANKYGMPSYHQLNIDIRYDFKGFLSGLGTQLLYVQKWKSGNQDIEKSYVINKVDMRLWNLVFNYNF
ncbi:MAG: OprD family outer membrane porin [Chitinophagia bacterium]